MPLSRRQKLNQALQAEGFCSLDSPRELLAQIAFCIDDDEDFGRLLMTIEVGKRRSAYEGLKSRLKFEPKPLSYYEEREYGRQSGIASRSTPVELGRKPGRDGEEAATEALRRGGPRLRLTCVKCARMDEFPAETLELAVKAARIAGWVYSSEHRQEYCTRCAARYFPKLQDLTKRMLQ